MMELHNLKPTIGARHKRVRIGRGESSGAGKTSGRGGKGQTARTGGKVRAGFEGGQMPIYRRIPKLGFRSRKRSRGENIYRVLSLDKLEQFDNDTVIDNEVLTKIFGKSGGAGYRILGPKGGFSKRLVIKVNGVSRAARKIIEEHGGKVEVVVK